MKDILIVAQFTQIPGEKGNGRFHYIAEKLYKSKNKVEVVTTIFSHGRKENRVDKKENYKTDSYK